MRWTKIYLGETLKTFHPSTSWTLWYIPHNNLITLDMIFKTLRPVHIYLYRIVLSLLMILTTMLGMNCEVTELVVFHPVDWIYNSISSRIVTTAIDFDPYRDALFNVNQYTLKVKQSLIDYSDTFPNSDPRYVHIINMIIYDLDSILNEITSTKLKPPVWLIIFISSGIIETKDSFYLLVYLFNFQLAQWMMKMLNQWNKIFRKYMITKLTNHKFWIMAYS